MIDQIRQVVIRLVQPLKSQIDSAVERVVVRAVDDALQSQGVTVEGITDEQDTLEHVQPFGLSFHPTDGAEGVAFAVGGQSEHRVVMGVQDRAVRPTAAGEGEGGLYQAGAYLVYIDADGRVNLGERVASDFVALSAKVLTELQKIRTWANAHTHLYTNSAGATPPTNTGLPQLSEPSSVAATNVRAT